MTYRYVSCAEPFSSQAWSQTSKLWKTRQAVLYEEQLQYEVPPNSKYSSRFLV